MTYEAMTFISVLLFASVHLWAPKALSLSGYYQGRFLSLGGGVAIKVDPKVKTAFSLK